jgi:5-methylcytosine-specific restriction endonuclease McrA
MCRKITFCQKHNIERSIKKRSNRNDEYYCKQCNNEKKRERNNLLNLNNPEWVAKQNYKNNLTKEDKILKFREYLRNYQKTEKRRDYILANLKCKESNLYCVKCNINRVYGKKICKKCNLERKFIYANDNISTCLFCKNSFGIETKLFNRDLFIKINSFCSLTCYNDNIKYNYEKRYNNFKNNEEKINRKREHDRMYAAKKRLEHPDILKQAIEKYKLTLKYIERINYNKYKSNVGKCSNLYCIECNDIRLYGGKICDKCKTIKKYKKYDFLSVCINCNKEYDLQTKLNNLGIVAQINKYCSEECNKQSRIINKKKNDIKFRNRYKRNRDDKQWAKIYGNKYEPINRSIVYRKYNYHCTSCNIKCVHPNKDNYNQPNAATLDHIIPKSKGGSHTYDNVTLLCRLCNTKKSDKMPSNYNKKQSQLQLEFIGYIPQGSQLELQMQ